MIVSLSLNANRRNALLPCAVVASGQHNFHPTKQSAGFG